LIGTGIINAFQVASQMETSLIDETVVEAEVLVGKEQVERVVPDDAEETEKTGGAQSLDQLGTVATAHAGEKKDVQQSQWAFSTWSWGEADPSPNQEPDEKSKVEEKGAAELPVAAIESRPSIVDFAWMVLEPVVNVATSLPPVPFSSDENAEASSTKKRRSIMEVPAKPPRGCGDALLHVGEVELQEGLLGWWRPCCLQLWPARLRAVALPDVQTEQDAESDIGQESKEGDVLWEMILDPTSFENASLVYDTCFEIVAGQNRGTFRCVKEAEADEWVKHITLIVNWVKEQIAARKWSFVHLNVYDLAGDWRVSAFNRMSLDMLQIGGMFHAGLEVYGREYMFGGGGPDDDVYGEITIDEDIYTLSSAEESGVSSCDPRACDRHRFRQTECLGLTTLSEKEVQDTLCVLARDWPSRCYRTLEKNCVHFCRDFSEQLGVTAVPDWVNYLAVSAAERHVIQPITSAGENAEDSSTMANREVMCFWKHPCVLQAQNWMAGLVEILVCESCLRELERGEPFYHCHECDFDMCEQCGEESRARANENAIGLVNAAS